MAQQTPYKVVSSKRARKAFNRLDRAVQERVLRALRRLAAGERQFKALTGEWKGHFSARMGDYRIIFRIDHKGRLIIVVILGHRREIYEI